MDAASFLQEIGDVLRKCETSSRELDALEFEADGRDVSVRVRREPHGKAYPSLPAILEGIGRTLAAQGVAVSALRRIVFLSDEIRVELAAGGRDRRAFCYPIQGALGPPTPDPPPALREPAFRIIPGAPKSA
jgi:hypothetical protein